MPEFKRLSQEEIDKIQVGTKVNFGNGDISEITAFSDAGIRSRYVDGKFIGVQEQFVHTRNLKTGEESKFYKHVLGNATTESLDPTAERCAYCQKIRPMNEMKSATIWVNRGKRTSRYCGDGPCAGYDQMASEG